MKDVTHVFGVMPGTEYVIQCQIQQQSRRCAVLAGVIQSYSAHQKRREGPETEHLGSIPNMFDAIHSTWTGDL